MVLPPNSILVPAVQRRTEFYKYSILLYRTISGLSPLTDGKFGIEKDETEITKIITDLYDNEGYKNQNTIASAFSLSNAGSIASIIQLLLM